MKLTPVDSIPGRMNEKYHDLQGLITEFANSSAQTVQVNFDACDYKSALLCSSCLRNAVKRSGHMIKVFKRGDTVFMRKM